MEPSSSNVIGGGNPGPHAIQGIGAGFIPENLDLSVIDDSIAITNRLIYCFCTMIFPNFWIEVFWFLKSNRLIYIPSLIL